MKNNTEMVSPNLIVKMKAGSHAYGTNIITSDVDHRGIFCANEENIRTPFFPIKEITDTTEEDSKYYELTNFFKLCALANPNIIELLYTDNSDIIQTSEAYRLLRENRHLFLSSKAAFTFSGYACAQLSRIRGHNKWISNPQHSEPPKQIDYIKLVHNFTDSKLFTLDIKNFRDGYRLVPYDGTLYGLYAINGYKTFNDKGMLNTTYDQNEDFFTLKYNNFTKMLDCFGGIRRSIRRQPLFIVKFCKEEYERAKEIHKNYWIWKQNRNVIRSELEEKYTYDTKHALHLVRLLRMGEEILTTGEVIVKRPDAEELLYIREGGWSYEQLITYTEQKDKYIREVLYKSTNLPKSPDLYKLSKLLIDIQDICWKK